MKGATVLLIAALAVLVILVAYAVSADPDWAQKGYWLANYIEPPWAVYARSDGHFDAAAQLALRRARDRPAPSAMDHLLSGTIITQNLLGREHRPVLGADGAPTRETVELARLRRDMLGDARQHFMAAIQRLGEPGPGPGPGQGQGARGPRGPVGGQAGLPVREPRAGFIIDAVADFAFGGMMGAFANDPVMMALMAEDWGPNQLPDFFPDEMGLEAFGGRLVDQPLAAAAFQRREELVADRQQMARQVATDQGGARGAATDTYLTLAVQNTDDRQNSHDASVLACFKAMVERLRADQASQALPTVDQVIAAIRAQGAQLSEARPYRVEEAVGVAQRTTKGERVVSIGATDEECLRRVWLRAYDPRNLEVRGRIHQAIFDALVDCWEEDIYGRTKHIACVNGRTTRILASLVLLDWDKRNWVVKRLEQFKNDIFERAGEVIAEKAAEAAASADAEHRKAGQLYLAKNPRETEAIGEVGAQATEALANEMRMAILAMVDRYVRELADEGIADAIPKHMVDAVKMEATAAVV